MPEKFIEIVVVTKKDNDYLEKKAVNHRRFEMLGVSNYVTSGFKWARK